MKKILGLSALYHDSAAALIIDGKIISAAQEERFSRRKHDAAFPLQAIKSVLSEGGISLEQVDHVVFYDKPFLKFERLLETYLARAPRGFASFRMAMPVWLREKLFLKDLLTKELRMLSATFPAEKLLFAEHHLSHAASAFFASPFERAVVLTLDGVGEWATTSVAIGDGNRLDIVRELHFPHSLGLLYSAFTYYCGFRVNSGEYKLMGLAPFGTPRYADLILDTLIDLKEDGSFRLDQSYFDYAAGLTMTNKRFHTLFGAPPRKPDSDPVTQFHMDVAASIQSVTEEVVLRTTRSLRAEFDIPALCLAGGVALNCVANGALVREGTFDHIWVQPASGDAGGALGAALCAHHLEFGAPRFVEPGDAMQGSYLGPSFSDETVKASLDAVGAVYECLSSDETIDRTARAIADGQAIGWFQGRMEYGPRALGNRSILADPRSETMQRTLNLKVKFRESFRPFAPSVLHEDVQSWFEFEGKSPYMLFVAKVAEHRRHPMRQEDKDLFGIDRLNIARSAIPAVTHVDYSARLQTVHAETNARYHALVSRFKALTGCPVLVNTSFNVRGEPIVGTPEDAFRCFMGTDLDALVIGNLYLRKSEQTVAATPGYKESYKLD